MPSRCFLAIDLAPGTVRLLDDADRAFLDLAPSWAGEKWVRPELRHITLRFIGPLADNAVADTLKHLGESVSSIPVFTLTLSGVRPQPSPRRATMLWASFGQGAGESAALASACDAMLTSRLDLEPLSARFTPHVTLVRARSRRAAPVEALDAARTVLLASKDEDRSVSVRSVTLYSSTLGRGGPEYLALGRASLGS
jgi:2'-5' RNA ligase